MTSALFTIGDLVINVSAFNLLNVSIASQRIMVKKNAIDLTLEKLQSGRDRSDNICSLQVPYTNDRWKAKGDVLSTTSSLAS